MKKRTKWIAGILAVIVIVGAISLAVLPASSSEFLNFIHYPVFLAYNLVFGLVPQSPGTIDLPNEGTYYCEELESSLSFEKDYTIYFSYNNTQIILLNGQGALSGYEGDPYNNPGPKIVKCSAEWKQDYNEINVQFYLFPGEYNQEKLYIFELIDNGA